ncbi:unnamed protein product [Protopolystoma xenopodis]|uniref:Uncharacterized protein n=1 Tax=Protopolystoma xenopodis TaxID=117903 RepID=A0A3S5AER9_9PLAT|nr:unnamed protein product [Protopolystoma xenopodis]
MFTIDTSKTSDALTMAYLILYLPLHSYHQTVPAAIPDLQLKATYGLVAPECPEGLVLQMAECWKEAYKGFDLIKLLDSIIKREVSLFFSAFSILFSHDT